MTENIKTMSLTKLKETLAEIEHPNHYLAWLLSTNIEISGTPYKKGDLYKEIVEENVPPNQDLSS